MHKSNIFFLRFLAFTSSCWCGMEKTMRKNRFENFDVVANRLFVCRCEWNLLSKKIDWCHSLCCARRHVFRFNAHLNYWQFSLRATDNVKCLRICEHARCARSTRLRVCVLIAEFRSVTPSFVFDKMSNEKKRCGWELHSTHSTLNLVCYEKWCLNNASSWTDSTLLNATQPSIEFHVIEDLQ